MDVEFDDPDLERLAFEAGYLGGWEPLIVAKYREAIRLMQAISRRESLYAWPGLNFEKLGGKRPRKRKKIKGLREYSVRLTIKWRLVFTFKKQSENESILILEIGDYHR